MSQQQMEGGMDKDCSALGMFFQTIINDMRVSSVVISNTQQEALIINNERHGTPPPLFLRKYCFYRPIFIC